jgi:hypothetical protein
MTTKQVTFDSLEIIELPMTLGDNSSVSKGPPLTVEWEAQQRTTFNVEFFEKFRPERQSRRSLVLSPGAREGILLNHGFSLEEILTASWEAATQKQNTRKKTKQARVSSQKQKRNHTLTELESRRRQAV